MVRSVIGASVLLALSTLAACDTLLNIHDSSLVKEDAGSDDLHDASTPDASADVTPDTIPEADATSLAPGTWAPPLEGQWTPFFADVTGDHMADLIVVATDGAVTVSPSTGSTFAAPSAWPALPPPPCGGSSACKSTLKVLGFADVTGDGRADAVTVATSGIDVFASTGSGFASPKLWSQSGGGTWGFDAWNPEPTTQFADMNGDGKADVVEINANSTDVLLSTGTEFVATAKTWLGAWHGDLTTAFADVTGDGKADCAAVEAAGYVVAYPSTGSTCDPGDAGFRSWNEGINFFRQPTKTFFADVDGDGAADTVNLNLSLNAVWTSTIQVLKSTGSNMVFQSSDWFEQSAAYSVYALADVNADQRSDLIGVDSAGVHVFLSNGQRFVVP